MLSKAMLSLMADPTNGVIRRMFTEAEALRAAGKVVFDFTLGNPDTPPPAELNAAIAAHSSDNHGYMPNAGFDFARAEMAKKVGREQGLPLTKDEIVMSVGAAGGLNCIFKVLLNPGDEVVTAAPYFGEYKSYAANFGAKLTAIPTLSNSHLDVPALLNAVNERTKIILFNSPNNPTGAVYRRDELGELSRGLSEIAKKLGCEPYLVADEPYRAITYDGSQVAAIFPFYARAVVVSSFAKSHSVPGERIGYLAINPNDPAKAELSSALALATRVLGFVNAPAIMQRAVAESWDCPVDYSAYDRRRALIMSVLDEAGLEYNRPEGAFYVFVRVPKTFPGGDDLAFCDRLKEEGILCAPGVGFGQKGYFRVAFCVPEGVITASRAAFKRACQ